MGVIFSLLRGEGHERRSQIQVTGNVYRNVYCKSGRIVVLFIAFQRYSRSRQFYRPLTENFRVRISK